MTKGTTVADATSQTVKVTLVTLTMTEEDALAIHALASRGEELPPDHPIRDGAAEVYLALDDVLQSARSFQKRVDLYNSIAVQPSAEW